MNITRRRLLEQSLAAAATVAAAGACRTTQPHRSSGRIPHGPIRIGVVGVRGRGRAHIKAFSDSPDSEVVAICDADEGVIGPAAQAVPEAKYVRDMRALLDDPGIDAISIATPNHWHALGTVWALEAKKHVYVEKPISYNLAEGRAVVDAARRHDRIVQHGTQARSQRATRDAIAWMQAGGIGQVNLATGLCYKRRNSIGKVEGVQQPPATLDYDLWTGPADLVPLRRKNLHYDWHWDFNTGNGDIGNQGVHQMDLARWGLGLTGFPQRVVSCGGRLGYDDDGNTPNTLISAYDYGPKQIVFEVRGLVTEGYRDTFIGVVFHGSDGYLVSSSYSQLTAFDPDGQPLRTFTGGADQDHYQNFLNAIRSGLTSDQTADSLEGHLSSGLCHLGNTSYFLGQACARGNASFGTGFDAGNEALQRMARHLDANGIAADEALRLGATLAFDPARERFTGDRADEANAFRTRPYREGFGRRSLVT